MTTAAMHKAPTKFFMLVEARGDPAVVLEPSERSLDAVALAIEASIAVELDLPIGARRDHGLHAAHIEPLADFLRGRV